ncbi:hypothetical protein CASFOL_035021 [Castilleja foliolosa]|uniref:Uncharacterized protein n=1 Tax=Castilleja foliolosa TaxID=1961234 RepID=A0ABD3BSP6_9LAMI
MIFSRIGSSLSRSSRFRNVINGANRGRSLLNGNSKQIDGNLMFIRGYLSTIGASKRPISRTFLSDFNHSTANPKISRFFSTQAPKKNDYEDFYRNSRFRGFKMKEEIQIIMDVEFGSATNSGHRWTLSVYRGIISSVYRGNEISSVYRGKYSSVYIPFETSQNSPPEKYIPRYNSIMDVEFTEENLCSSVYRGIISS